MKPIFTKSSLDKDCSGSILLVDGGHMAFGLKLDAMNGMQRGTTVEGVGTLQCFRF